MTKKHCLPFVVGQLAEAKSFLRGYRGAWFRCKIKQIKQKEGHLSYLLEYYEFPDEKDEWTRVYQSPVGRKLPKKQLMVRPEFPPLYHPSQLPAVSSMPEVIVVADGTWKVGDFVDWRKDDCYWSGKVTHIVGSGKAEIEFPPPPTGEGKSYEVPFEDLRPSLEWSPENGWMMPKSTDDGSSSQSAQLIQKVNQASRGHLAQNMPAKLSKTDANDQTAYESLSSPSDAEAGLSGINSRPQVVDGIGESAAQTSENDPGGSDLIRTRFMNNRSVPLNSMRSNTLDAAIVDLEELAYKIRWLKGILKGTDATSNSVRPMWKFTENRGSSLPK